jgi:hypothetical protein
LILDQNKEKKSFKEFETKTRSHRNTTMKKISINCVGRLGGAFAVALSQRGFRIESLIVRNKSNAE